MSSFPMEVGRVVFSRAGRDQGHYFVIVDVIDEEYVAIANGCQRKVDNPKKKKIKHLVAKPELLEEISKKTNRSRNDLINMLLDYAMDYCEIHDENP